MTPTTLWCQYAWLPEGIAAGVRLTIVDSRIESVAAHVPKSGAIIEGLVLPGFANNHSHAFHRALRGRTHHERGTFWTWRRRMYELAARLDPDSYHRLARGVYAEMVLSGYTSVGEFHYVHHAPGGKHYADPNAMSAALVRAAADAGIRITLLDTCYLAGGFGRELEPSQARFSDGDAAGWAERVEAFMPEGKHVRVGAAVHSARAVPAEQLPTVAETARGRPLHVHLSEQRGENEECLAQHGKTPTVLLGDAGVLGEHTVAVHGTHLTEHDIELLGRTTTRVCFCPTTERDLGDGIGPAGALTNAGVRLCLGSDSHAIIDPVEETRALELNERLATESRGRFNGTELLAAATDHGAIGWNDVGNLAAGAQADLVAVDLTSVRTSGIEPDGALFAACSTDIRDVMIGGRWIVRDQQHQTIERPHTALAEEIDRLWRQ
jgi:formiminoglutamate deiminase